MAAGKTLYEKLSNSQAITVSIGLGAAGLIGLILVSWLIPVDTAFFYPLLSALSGVLLTTGGLGFLWDLVGRRNLTREVLHHVGLAEEIVQAGITKAAETVAKAPWSELITSSRVIKVHLAYGGSWFSNNTADLRRFAENRRSRLDVFLPDPTNDVVVASLGSRFKRDEDLIRSRIWEAASEVLSLAKSARGVIKVHFRSGQPTHSFYQFDDKFVLVLYPHTGIRTTETPFLVLESGTFGKFVEADFIALSEQSREVGAGELAQAQSTSATAPSTREGG